MNKTIIAASIGICAGIAYSFISSTMKKPDEATKNSPEGNPTEENAPEQKQQSKFMIPRPIPNSEQYKLVIGINMELKTSQPEICSILGDAVIKAVTQAVNTNSPCIGQWLYYGQAKISVKVPNAEELRKLVQAAQTNNVPYVTVDYQGKPAAIACGPGPIETVNGITGHLKLL